MDERDPKARHLVANLKARYWPVLNRDVNLVAAGYGRRTAQGQRTDHPALVFYVMKKVPTRFLPTSRLLPRRMYIGGDCVEVDVVETGPLFAHAFTARERPAPSGISIGPPVIGGTISAGTLGCLVTDLTDQSQCILSNNHVMANENAAKIGDPILQPGSFDGGTDPADRVATLKRFVVLNPSGNVVDCAIAQVTAGQPLVIDQMKNDLMPTPGPKHPAVGLLFAGGCNRMLMNPIANVLSALNIQFLAGAGSTVAAEVGMAVEKVGRTTEYTTSNITEIDLTVSVNYDTLGSVSLDHQLATMWMDDAGDSGSIVCQGGAGSATDNCGCGTTSAGSTALGVDLKPDAAMATEVRDKFLRHTKIGRYAIDLFTLNEERFLERFRRTNIKEADRELAREMYHKYIAEARHAFVEGENSERTVTEQQIHDARTALKHAQKYMFKDEVEASDQLFRLAEEHGKGKNARQILALLNDEKLLRQIQEIAGKVKSVRTQEGGACG